MIVVVGCGHRGVTAIPLTFTVEGLTTDEFAACDVASPQGLECDYRANHAGRHASLLGPFKKVWDDPPIVRDSVFDQIRPREQDGSQDWPTR